MKVFLNGSELKFAEGGYKYNFIKPYQQVQKNEITKKNGDRLIVELYDNGVQIRTLVSAKEINTIINRELTVDLVNKKIYILEDNTQYERKEDGSIKIFDDSSNL